VQGTGSRCFLNYMLRVEHVAWYKSRAHDKGQLAAKWGRKATGLFTERWPGCRKENGCYPSIPFITLTREAPLQTRFCLLLALSLTLAKMLGVAAELTSIGP
jgi:hypothetical protein